MWRAIRTAGLAFARRRAARAEPDGEAPQPTLTMLDRPRRLCRRIAASRIFEIAVIAMILVTAVGLGLETSRTLGASFGAAIRVAYAVALAVFALEAAIKLIAVAPRFGRYFRDGWNLFDFTVLVLALLPEAGSFALIARLARLLRVLRVVTVAPQLRLIVSTLIRSLPGLGNVMLLLSVVYYVYAVAGVHLFGAHDPTHWGSLGIALLTLFRVMTLEDWTDVMYIAMALHPMSWVFFVSFVMLAAVIMINLVIAVVIDNLHNARLEVATAGAEETLGAVRKEAAEARDAIERIEAMVADLKK